MKFKRIAIDTSKHVFTMHGVDEQERAFRRELKRGQVEAFFGKLPGTELVLEACCGSHHCGRMFQEMGHRVRLILPQYVKPFVKHAKNDRNDAEAISEAAARPSMRSVAVKTVDHQAKGIIVKHREMLVGQRTQAINALRGHATEFGVVAAKGATKSEALLAVLAADTAFPDTARTMFAQIGAHIAALESRIAVLYAELRIERNRYAVRVLSDVEGGGDFGLPQMVSCLTGGKQRLGKISKAGNERLRSFLVVGAMFVIRFAKPGSRSASPWL